MNREQTVLWQRIREFELDDPHASFPFSARLARENGWSRGFARRVVDQYKRFVFLTMVAGHDVTPSEQVDEAWHLHLTYTHNYWQSLCRGVLGRPLHHVPTRGGPDETARHLANYNQTLASYQKWFDNAAPSDIWPPAEIRFGDDLDHVRVNRHRSWIIPKPNLWPAPRRLAPWIAAAAIPPMLWGSLNPLDLSGPDFLAFYAIVAIVAVGVAFVLRRALRVDQPADEHAEPEPHEIACLGRGASGVLQTTLAGLVARHALEVVETPPAKIGKLALGSASYKLRATAPVNSSANDIERVMLSTATGPDGAEAAVILRAAKPVAEAVESELQARGLLESDASFGPPRWWPLMLLSGVLGLGVIKLCVGLARDKPVAILTWMLIGLVIAMFFLSRKPLRTRRGERLLDELKRKYESLKTVNFAEAPTFGTSDMLLVAGLFGLMAVDHPDIRHLNSALKPIAAGDGGFASGCGTGGDGGGGGGDGGGGGCGGCGGGS